jgi:carbamoyltransferase
MSLILGISAFYHDSAAALVIDGVVVAAAQEERFTRKKHESNFPRQAIAFCLAQAGREIEELDHVVFYEKPFLKFERILETHLAHAPRGLDSFMTSIPIWLRSKLYISRIISKGLEGRYKKRILFVEHHQSHAASAFFQSPFKEAAILSVDGAGEWTTTAIGIGADSKIQLQHELHFPDSLGLLYSAFTYFCGFRINSGEGKLMGLAPFGTPDYAETILENLIDLQPDGSFQLNQEFFDYCTGRKMTSPKFNQLFGGPPRTPESPITQREKNLAASIQLVTESALLKIANHLYQLTQCDQLCIAGGVALNCVANGKLLQASPFEKIWVNAAPGDAGGAIGAALFTWHQILENPKSKNVTSSPFLGPDYSDSQIRSTLQRRNAIFQKLSSDELTDTAASDLASEKIIGWFQNRMEFGPRALGNRSILADPRPENVQDELNRKVKFREPFRPFAPVILQEESEKWFSTSQSSPLMSFAAHLHSTVPKTKFPGITHVDRSSRIQTIASSDNPILHQLLERFRNETDCPMLVNTSFNVRGEPIVCSPDDAYQCFMKTNLDALAIGNFYLRKQDQPAFNHETRPEKQKTTWLNRISNAWQIITFPMRWVVSKLALILVYYLCICPISLLIYRLKIKNKSIPVSQTGEKTISYWRPRNPPPNKTSYFRQY